LVKEHQDWWPGQQLGANVHLLVSPRRVHRDFSGPDKQAVALGFLLCEQA